MSRSLIFFLGLFVLKTILFVSILFNQFFDFLPNHRLNLFLERNRFISLRLKRSDRCKNSDRLR